MLVAIGVLFMLAVFSEQVMGTIINIKMKWQIENEKMKKEIEKAK